MRSIGPLPCITLISMLATAAVTTLILVLDGHAEYWLVAGTWALSITVHFRDRKTLRQQIAKIEDAAMRLRLVRFMRRQVSGQRHRDGHAAD
jgi:hypothetical protein